MGCYMSVPDNKVYVTEGKGENFSYATASCQGWRREQEDAEDCIPDFDENASLFILCDGHGGPEVAKYTVKHLPNFIKNHPLYKEGNYPEALRNAFIDFDALMRTEKVLEELHELSVDDDKDGKESKVLDLNKEETTEANNKPAGSSLTTDNTTATFSSPSAGTSGSTCTSSSHNGSSTVVDDVDTETLRREAQLPLRELLNEYSAISGMDQAKRNSLMAKYNSSPVVGNKQENNETDPNCGTSSSSNFNEDNPSASSSKQPADEDDCDEAGPSTSIGHESIKEAIMKQVMEKYFQGDEDSSDDSEFDGDDSSNDDDGDDEGDDEGGRSLSKKLRRKKYKRPVDEPLGSSSEDDDDDEEEDEEENDSDSDEDDELADEEDDDDDGEEEAESSEFEVKSPVEVNYDDPQNFPPPDSSPPLEQSPRVHKPGYDSGCTVVVALLKDGKLYVASAGDSRCIVVKRDATCVPMSFDHKPSNQLERRRIERAGGRVWDGRVNGGLNLSRALGDFAYKRFLNSDKPEDNMISPLPDIKVAFVNPKDVEYIFLACDGIWNSMKNQEVSYFIHKTIPAVSGDLVETCVQLFRRCIAPGTDGDGTGCDNMTCILARFEGAASEISNKSDLKTEQEGSESVVSSSQKRSGNDDSSDEPVKRRCLSL